MKNKWKPYIDEVKRLFDNLLRESVGKEQEVLDKIDERLDRVAEQKKRFFTSPLPPYRLMNLREEKRAQIMNYCWLKNKEGVEPLLAAYLLWKTDGKKEAVERFEEKRAAELNYDWYEYCDIKPVIDQRKKEMLEPLSTPTTDE